MTALEASIRIEVEAQYIEQQSDPDQDKFLFSYTITITNEGTSPAVLESRHWIITDANGHTNEVQAAGLWVKPQPSPLTPHINIPVAPYSRLLWV